MAAIVEIHLVNILDETNSMFAAVVSSEVVLWSSSKESEFEL